MSCKHKMVIRLVVTEKPYGLWRAAQKMTCCIVDMSIQDMKPGGKAGRHPLGSLQQTACFLCHSQGYLHLVLSTHIKSCYQLIAVSNLSDQLR